MVHPEIENEYGDGWKITIFKRRYTSVTQLVGFSSQSFFRFSGGFKSPLRIFQKNGNKKKHAKKPGRVFWPKKHKSHIFTPPEVLHLSLLATFLRFLRNFTIDLQVKFLCQRSREFHDFLGPSCEHTSFFSGTDFSEIHITWANC